ncbi:MAG: SRPBCC family protein [Nannocystales bacterium]
MKNTNHGLRDILLLVTMLAGGCSGAASDRTATRSVDNESPEAPRHRVPSDLVEAPLRNEVRATLETSIHDAWRVLSDHGALPSYAAGIQDVTVADGCSDEDGGGMGCQRTCLFKEGPPVTEEVVFIEEPYVLAMRGVGENSYQLTNDLTLVTLADLGNGKTEVLFRMYFDHPEPSTMAAATEQGFRGMGDGLVRRFGGRVHP